jgi:hypothetical protein
MPTGYTADIYDGKKPVTLRDFAVSCARAFVWQWRETDPSPEELKPSDYYPKHIEELEQQLAALLAMPPEEAEAASLAEFTEAVKDRERWEREREAVGQRYRAMLAKVKDWDAPEALLNLKRYMIEQLNQSIEFDVGVIRSALPEKLPSEKWLRHRKDDLLRELTYYRERQDEETENLAQANAFIKSLYEVPE